MGTGAAKGKPPAAAEEVAGGDPESDGYRPVKRSTLAHILKEARLDLDTFLAFSEDGNECAELEVGGGLRIPDQQQVP